jgi:S-adenosylmethionine/arginine decarboxylase-like enzyme
MTAHPYQHLHADLVGVPPAQLGDVDLLSGLLIAAASGAGLTAVGAPAVRRLPDGGVAGVLLLECCHIAVHAVPSRQLLLLDVLVLATQDARKALDVFARRLTPRDVRSDTRGRG